MNFRAHIIFSAFTCMRPAEVEALLKVNVLRDRVQVRRNVSGGIEVDSPKNGKWRNHVPLAPAARAVLDALPQTQTPYVFHNKRGQKLSKSTQHLYWDLTRTTMAAKTGDPAWRTMDFYELRHFGASFAWNVLRLPVEVVAWMLGHSDTTLVTDVYGHPNTEIWHEEAMEAFRRHDAKKQAAADEAAGVPRLRAVE
jgi:integrase